MDKQICAVHNADMVIDGLQYINPSRAIFEDWQAGAVRAVHMTVCYHEDFEGVCRNLETWHKLLQDHDDLLRPATASEDLSTLCDDPRTVVVFGLQNPLPFGTNLSRISTLRRLGILFAQITYNQQSLLGSGCFEPVDAGLTAFGRESIAEMNQVGMIIDLSHASHATCLQTIKASQRPVAITHANPKTWRDVPRNIKAEVLQALREKNGMLGFSLYPHHLPDGSDCTLGAFCDGVADMVGTYGADMFGIGSDLCQGQPDSVVNWMRNGDWKKIPAAAVSFPPQPSWFQSNRDYPGIAQGMSDAGLGADTIHRIMGQNWLRFWREGIEPA